MQMQPLPLPIVNDIVNLVNAFNKTDALVIQIDPIHGRQHILPNPTRLSRLTTSVIEIALLLKKQMIAQQVLNEIVTILDNTHDVPDELREATRLIREFATRLPEVDGMVEQTIQWWWDNNRVDPIAQAFYNKACDIANQLSDLSTQTRLHYFTKVIDTLHRENPELDIPMYDFITGYTQHTLLHQCVTEHMLPEVLAQLELRNGPVNDYVSLLVECKHNKCVSNLDIFEWADKKNRYLWLTVVNGEYNRKREPLLTTIKKQIYTLYSIKLKHHKSALLDLLSQMEEEELQEYLHR